MSRFEEQIPIRMSKELKTRLEKTAESSVKAQSQADVIRAILDEHLDELRKSRIEKKKVKIEELQKELEKEKKEIKELQKKHSSVLVKFGEKKDDIKEYMEKELKRAERKNRDMDLKKEGLVSSKLKNEFGIQWTDELAATKILKQYTIITRDDIEDIVSSFLDKVEEDKLIAEIRGDECGEEKRD